MRRHLWVDYDLTAQAPMLTASTISQLQPSRPSHGKAGLEKTMVSRLSVAIPHNNLKCMNFAYLSPAIFSRRDKQANQEEARNTRHALEVALGSLRRLAM